MDGLPVSEANNCSYASTHEGKMHACGHDGHMSMVLTFGEYIDKTKNLNHNVLLIFQPAEETLGGAEEICKKRYNRKIQRDQNLRHTSLAFHKQRTYLFKAGSAHA